MSRSFFSSHFHIVVLYNRFSLFLHGEDVSHDFPFSLVEGWESLCEISPLPPFQKRKSFDKDFTLEKTCAVKDKVNQRRILENPRCAEIWMQKLHMNMALHSLCWRLIIRSESRGANRKDATTTAYLSYGKECPRNT